MSGMTGTDGVPIHDVGHAIINLGTDPSPLAQDDNRVQAASCHSRQKHAGMTRGKGMNAVPPISGDLKSIHQFVLPHTPPCVRLPMEGGTMR